REGERLLTEGVSVENVAKALEVSEATYSRWRNQYGGMKANEAKELRQLRGENSRLKRMVADLALDVEMLKEVFAGKILSPARRRKAVLHLRRQFKVSERRACRAVGQHRTTQRRRLRPVTAVEATLRERLREISKDWPRYGYRMAWGLLRMEGWRVNRKRVQRLWREDGLRVPERQAKRRRVGSSTVPASRLRAEHPNHVWALDFLFDTTSDGRPFKVLSMCDEFTRESIGGKVARSITSDDLLEVLDQAVKLRGVPKLIRCDNGPEFIAAALKDWCRFLGTGTAYIDPGSPWQNQFVESFNGRARDELFAREIFASLMEAKVLYQDWREHYNQHRPHSSLGYQPP
ncbi:MAG: IS3 family transposase, partial [Candidatus Dormibacteraceae bacterium]